MGRQNGVAATRTRSKNPLQYARISLTYALTIGFSYYTTYLVVSKLHFMRSSKRQSQGAGKFIYIRTDHKYFHQKLRMKNIHHNLFFPQFDEASFEKKSPVMVFQYKWLFSRMLHRIHARYSGSCHTEFKTNWTQIQILRFKQNAVSHQCETVLILFGQKKHNFVYCMFHPLTVQNCLIETSNRRCIHSFLEHRPLDPLLRRSL